MIIIEREPIEFEETDLVNEVFETLFDREDIKMKLEDNIYKYLDTDNLENEEYDTLIEQLTDEIFEKVDKVVKEITLK